jgi:hypothetical protein
MHGPLFMHICTRWAYKSEEHHGAYDFLFNFDILIIPDHTTQVLQPFDVRVAAQSRIQTTIEKEINSLAAELTDGQRTKADALQCHMVAAFLNGFHKVTTPGNLYSAFAATGFIPFSPTHPLDSAFVATAPPGVFEGIIRQPSAVNAKLLTDPDCLRRLFAEENCRMTTDQDLSLIDLETIWNRLMMSKLQSGPILTSRPMIWVRETERQARVI